MSDGGAENTETTDTTTESGGGELDSLKAKVSEFRDNNVKLLKELERFKGIDPDEVRSMQTKLQELEHQSKASEAGITNEQLKTLRAEIRKDLEKEYSGLQGEVESLRADNRGLRLDSVVKDEMSKAGVRAERIDALFRLNSDKFDLTDDGVPFIKERPGAEIAKFVAEDLRKEFPEFYNGSGASGGGASKSSGGVGQHGKIAASDKEALSHNLEKIASGDIEVVMPG